MCTNNSKCKCHLIRCKNVGPFVARDNDCIIPEFAFGSLYGETNGNIAIQNVAIEFDFSGPVSNILADPATNSITVLISGVYEISAGLLTNDSESGALYAICKNNAPIAGSLFGTSFEVTVAINAKTSAKTIQTALIAGDILTVVPMEVNNNPKYLQPSITVNLISRPIV